MVAGDFSFGSHIVQGALDDPSRQEGTTEDERQWQRQYMTADVSLLRPLKGGAGAPAGAKVGGGANVRDQKHAIAGWTSGKTLLMRLPQEGTYSALHQTHEIAKEVADKAAKKDWDKWEQEKQKVAVEKKRKEEVAKKGGEEEAGMAALKEANEAKGDEWVRSLDEPSEAPDKKSGGAFPKRKKAGGKGGGGLFGCFGKGDVDDDEVRYAARICA